MLHGGLSRTPAQCQGLRDGPQPATPALVTTGHSWPPSSGFSVPAHTRPPATRAPGWLLHLLLPLTPLLCPSFKPRLGCRLLAIVALKPSSQEEVTSGQLETLFKTLRHQMLASGCVHLPPVWDSKLKARFYLTGSWATEVSPIPGTHSCSLAWSPSSGCFQGLAQRLGFGSDFERDPSLTLEETLTVHVASLTSGPVECWTWSHQIDMC